MAQPTFRASPGKVVCVGLNYREHVAEGAWAAPVRSWHIPVAGPDAGRPVLMQYGSNADMIWGVNELLEFITGSVTLEPGDIVATGTPSGVGVFRDPPVFLEPGDRVRCEIEGIGSVENPVVDWSDERP